MVGPATGWPAGPKTMSSLREPCARAAGAAMVARVMAASAIAARACAALLDLVLVGQASACPLPVIGCDAARKPRSYGLRCSTGAQASFSCSRLPAGPVPLRGAGLEEL